MSMKPNTLIDAHKSVHHDSVDFIYSTFMVYMLPLFRWFFEWLGFCYPTSESPSIVVSDVVNATQTFVEPLLQKFKNTYDSKDRGVEKYNASVLELTKAKDASIQNLKALIAAEVAKIG